MAQIETDASLAVRFLNAGTGADPDPLATPREAARWLERTVPAGGAPASPSEARALFAEARALSGAIDELFRARTDGRPLPDAPLYVVERALSAGLWRRRVTRTDDGVVLDTRPASATGPLARLAPLAAAAVELLADVDPERLRSCAADDCRRWFVDTSRGGQRRWCSMATCGNRAKAARWRERRGDR